MLKVLRRFRSARARRRKTRVPRMRFEASEETCLELRSRRGRLEETRRALLLRTLRLRRRRTFGRILLLRRTLPPRIMANRLPYLCARVLAVLHFAALSVCVCALCGCATAGKTPKRSNADSYTFAQKKLLEIAKEIGRAHV